MGHRARRMGQGERAIARWSMSEATTWYVSVMVLDRKRLKRSAPLFIALVGGCSAGSPVRAATHQQQRCANIVLPPVTVSQASWSRLEPSLSHHFNVWRVRLMGARCNHQQGEVARLEAERVTVSIVYEGDVVGAFRAAGLQPGYDSAGHVSGHIGLRDLEQLAGVPGIVRMTMQPEVHPD